VKSVSKIILGCIVAMAAQLASAQSFIAFNPPPCDFSDVFYNQNGVDQTQLVGRFGDARLTGAPATQPNQNNWIADTTCATNDPTRRNVRILATTGAYRDSDGAPTEFFSLLAFMVNSSVFESNFTGTQGDSTITYTNGANPRGYTTQFLVGNFVGFAAPTQKMANGALAPTPCGSQHDPNIAATDCFTVGKTSSGLFAIDTPNLRQDWRLTSNRNAIDGSDNNCVNTQDQNCKSTNNGLQDSPFGYFCDDLLGTWLIHYWWYNQNAIGGIDDRGGTITPTANCTKILSCAASVNGTSLDGTPIIKTGGQLHFLEGVPGTSASVFPNQACLSDSDLPPNNGACAADHAITPTGADGGAVWIICPDLPDPRNGAIASDAFLDAVRLPSGAFQSADIANNFNCLQQTGKLCSEAAPGK
jgi:hypothetical protein